jgi:hypothetical protein
LAYGLFGVDIKNRKITLYDQGTNRFDTTNLDTVGKAVAKILSMPTKFANERVFISGMTVSQVDILGAFKRATGSQDWTVEHKSASGLRAEGFAKIAAGDYSGIVDVIEASNTEPGSGALYSSERKLANEELGVKDDLNASVQQYVNKVQP